MKITYADNMTPEEYNYLRKAVGWREITPGQAKRGLENTTFLVAARAGEEIVAMGRVLFDFGYTAYIGDVIVSPEYQRQGIGAHIVKELIDKTLDAAETGDRIMFILGAAKGKEAFYERFGFNRRPNDMSGHGMSMYKVKE